MKPHPTRPASPAGAVSKATARAAALQKCRAEEIRAEEIRASVEAAARDTGSVVHGSRALLLIPGHLRPGLLQRGPESLHLCAERSQFPPRNTVVE